MATDLFVEFYSVLFYSVIVKKNWKNLVLSDIELIPYYAEKLNNFSEWSTLFIVYY